MLDIILDALLDTAKLLPFLFLTYLLLEWIEHKAANKTASLAAKAGKFGPAIGGLLGAVPQCGFSASASNLYAGGIISMGTLVAIFISTSDEMLPIMISEHIAPLRVFTILGIKVLCGVVVGFCIDVLFRFRKKKESTNISHLCEEENCHCENGILLSSLIHTAQIAFFIFIFSFLIGTILHFVGEETLSSITANAGIFSPIIAGVVGLIPNCASSVVLTELYLSGVISTGSLLSGLIANSGVGLLILFRVHKNHKNNILIMSIICATGILVGIIVDLLRIVI